MRSTRGKTVLVALGAMLLLLGLLIGVPVVLWALARSPIPTSLPSLADIGNGLTRGPIADSTILKVVALIGWLAWLQITLSVIVETAAWARGLSSPKLIAAGPIQPAVRRLIATVALIMSNPTIAAAAAPAPAVPVVQELVASPPAATPTHIPPAPVVIDPTTTPTGSAAASKVHTVQRRDTLWGLAETHLGDPVRWPDLYELNRGCVQADGRSLQDPNLIVVGWQLHFPDDAVGIEPAAPAITEPAPNDQPESAPIPPPSRAPEAVAPPVTQPATTTASTTATTAATTPTAANRNVDTPPAIVADSDSRPAASSDARPLMLLVGGGLLAASIVVLINRLRRVRTRHRRTPEPLRDHLQRAELQLRHAADLDGATRLDLALRAFATGLRDQGGPPLSVMAVRLVEGDIDVLLDQPATNSPYGFESTGNPRGWQLRPDIDDAALRKLANGATAPLPSLVTIGLGDGAPVLVDIETAGLITIGGNPDLTVPYLRRIAIELATSTWTDHLDLITVGETLADITGGHRVRHYDDPGEAVHQLLLIADASADQLASSGHTTTLHARIADEHGDGWIPTILISSQALDDKLTSQLVERVSAGRGVGAIAPGPVPTKGWHADLTGNRVVLSPHNLTLDAVVLAPDIADAIDQILTDLTIDPPTDHPIDQVTDAELDAVAETPTPAIASTSEPIAAFAETPPEVIFRVLGSIDVVGIAPIERRKSMEIATYLALHSPDGVTDDRIRTIFWPDDPPSKETFNTTMSMTRSALGSNSAGELYLPHFATTHQRYRVTDKVTTDLAQFETRAAYAKTVPGAAAKPLLAEALGMVRGQPFDVSRGYEWAFTESFVTRASIAIADAAQHLAEIALADGDSTTAEWAATRGLRAAPGDEGLYRLRMRAAKTAGNTSAIRQILNELCESIEANEPYDQLDPKTIELFESLTGKGARTGTVRFSV